MNKLKFRSMVIGFAILSPILIPVFVLADHWSEMLEDARDFYVNAWKAFLKGSKVT